MCKIVRFQKVYVVQYYKDNLFFFFFGCCFLKKILNGGMDTG